MRKVMGLVLAGGRSTRMGRDKWRLPDPLRPDRNFLARAVSVLSSVASPCLVSCPVNAPIAGYACIQDKAAGQGPMGGIAAGLEKAAKLGYAGIFALACDLPRMKPDLLARLLDYHQPDPEPLLTVFVNASGGKPEMLAAIYATAALPLLLAALERGERSLRRAIPEKGQRRLAYGERDAPFFLNCNTEEDLRNLSRQPLF